MIPEKVCGRKSGPSQYQEEKRILATVVGEREITTMLMLMKSSICLDNYIFHQKDINH